MKYDLVIFGGGTSGIAAAYTASKLGLNTLLIEASDVLGGAITQGLVIPVMKLNSENINTDFYSDLLFFAKKYNAQNTFSDGNTGWFNPELLKIVFDDMLNSVQTKVLFSTTPTNIKFDTSNRSFSFDLKHKILSLHIDTEYIIDATAFGEIFKILNYDFQKENDLKQACSLRFNISNVDLNIFSSFLKQIDNNRDVTPIYESEEGTHLSTAYTWDTNKQWALAPIFEKALRNGDLKANDNAYFQLFTIANMPNTVAINAPRIILEDKEDIHDPFIYSNALKQGRERIFRIYNFCKKYLKGFENSFISHISDTLGVREYCRIKGKYTFTKDDVLTPKNFDNIAFACDYPIDIHSSNKENDELSHTNKTCYVPIDVLICEQNDYLYGIGKILSADFEAHSALRTQMSCFSMGEAAAKDIFSKINK